MIFIGIALLVAAGLVLLISADAGSLVGLTQTQTAQLIPLLILLIIFAGGLFARRCWAWPVGSRANCSRAWPLSTAMPAQPPSAAA